MIMMGALLPVELVVQCVDALRSVELVRPMRAALAHIVGPYLGTMPNRCS